MLNNKESKTFVIFSKEGTNKFSCYRFHFDDIKIMKFSRNDDGLCFYIGFFDKESWSLTLDLKEDASVINDIIQWYKIHCNDFCISKD